MKKEELIHVPELTAIQVGGQTYDVVIDDRLTTEMNAFGATFFGENLIKLHPHQLGSQMANSIIHEAIHALHNEWNVMPIDDKEEQVTTTMANAVLLFLRDNPDFLVTVMGLLGKPIKFLSKKEAAEQYGVLGEDGMPEIPSKGKKAARRVYKVRR